MKQNTFKNYFFVLFAFILRWITIAPLVLLSTLFSALAELLTDTSDYLIKILPSPDQWER